MVLPEHEALPWGIQMRAPFGASAGAVMGPESLKGRASLVALETLNGVFVASFMSFKRLCIGRRSLPGSRGGPQRIRWLEGTLKAHKSL